MAFLRAHQVRSRVAPYGDPGFFKKLKKKLSLKTLKKAISIKTVRKLAGAGVTVLPGAGIIKNVAGGIVGRTVGRVKAAHAALGRLGAREAAGIDRVTARLSAGVPARYARAVPSGAELLGGITNAYGGGIGALKMGLPAGIGGRLAARLGNLASIGPTVKNAFGGLRLPQLGRLRAAAGALGAGALAGGAAVLGTEALTGYISGRGRRRYRRMNPLNIRALRRAARRVCRAEETLREVMSIRKRVHIKARSSRKGFAKRCR